MTIEELQQSKYILNLEVLILRNLQNQKRWIKELKRQKRIDRVLFEKVVAQYKEIKNKHKAND